MERRTAIKWVLTAAASPYLLAPASFAAKPITLTAERVAGGYGPDPDILRTYKPGDVWPLTMTSGQRATTIALCDLIIPADSGGPAASALGVHAFIDEWISAPYPGHDADRRTVIEGLSFIDAESRDRFGKKFVDLSNDQKTQLCDELSRTRTAGARVRKGAQFFKRFRDLTAGGYYTTPEGMKDIGYVGNRPAATFDGPSPDLLLRAGVA
jgi:hypothetical protein